ncbi:MAG: chromosome segregation protein SMC, partial [Clostridiales bacterium]|nr:chromosome segregation protein SMC [Clostridiales bacterium]
MYLKSLEMQGFKSFAEKINMAFGTGITAVVGPNGSGKSNISDAIRWVMGEQSAKSLRGGNMQDVIFAGTQKRKPLGFAEVTLVIDNADKKLAIAYDEVTVTRRVYRSGESEYFINKASCRLKDIHELFMDTGVGRDGYSVIGQGKIGEIISSKAEDRRQIFEEAAGITKYRYRKEEAERKLAHTRENVLRVSDIITELETQLTPLKQQSEKAKKYLGLRERLKVLEVNVSLENIARFQAALDEAAAAYGDIGERVNGVREEIEAAERETAQMFDSMRESEEAAEEKRERQNKGTQLMASHQSDIEVLKSKIAYNRESVKRVNGEIAELNARLDALEEARSEQDGGAALLAEQDSALTARIRGLGGEADALARSEAECREKAEGIGADIVEKMNALAALKGKTGNYRALTESFAARLTAIETELGDKEEQYARLAGGVDDLRRELDEKNAGLDALRREGAARTEEIAALRERGQAAREHRQRTRIALEQAQARRKLLDDMEKSFDHYSRSVKSVMRARQNGELANVEIFGTVAQLLQVPAKYAVAVETALGAAAQNIITRTENDAKRAIDYLKRTKAGRATFLPISAAKGGKLAEKGLSDSAGYIGIASDLISYNEELRAVADGLLGRVAVADTIDHAIAIARKYGYRFRVVTLEGELLTPGGAMSGGSGNHTAGLFSRANELAQLGKREEELRHGLRTAEGDEENAQRALTAALSRAEEADAALRTAQEECIALASEVKHSAAFLQSVAGAKDALEAEKVQISEKTAHMRLDIAQGDADAEAARAELAALEELAGARREEAARLVRQREEKAAELVTLQMEQSGVKKDIALHNERVELWNARKLEITRSIEQKERDIEEITDKNDDLDDDVTFKTRQIEELQQDVASLKAEVAALQSGRRQTEDDMKNRQKTL